MTKPSASPNEAIAAARAKLAEADKMAILAFGHVSQRLFAIHNLYPFAEGLSAFPSDENLEWARAIAALPADGLEVWVRQQGGCRLLAADAEHLADPDEHPGGPVHDGAPCSCIAEFQAIMEPELLDGSMPGGLDEWIEQACEGRFVPGAEAVALARHIARNFDRYGWEVQSSVLFFLGKIAPSVACEVALEGLGRVHVRAFSCFEELKRLVDLMFLHGEATGREAPVDVDGYFQAAYLLLHPPRQPAP
ncbi:hypothetical protein [Acidovorax sp. PRC11]|uniref:hypothetical protein n=1 Tax=Acidovorax sp. PRC11 TaxID=2962592 RepID=UPI00288244EA|nr:hypothetical protein [Acidovorax sp. PRC11]MDT0137468.1 hypothetical protein [Acidovorax sp. PRC11]